MKQLVKIVSAILLIAAIYSFAPAVALYLKPDPAIVTNIQAIEQLKDKKGELFEFIVIGDTHSGLIYSDGAALKTIRQINREDRFKKAPIDFVISPGDVSFRGSEWDYRTFNKIRSSIKRPFINTIGNHDDDKGGFGYFKKYSGDPEFSFSLRNSYFIFLDNKVNELTERQFLWLEDELKKSLAYKHRFVVIHKSPLSPYQQAWFKPELSVWSYRFMKLCEEYKVDIVFSGHEHMFKELVHGKVKYITSGGGGMVTQIPSPDGGFLNYLIVRVYGDYVDYEVRKIFPPLWEYLTYYMWKDLFWFLKSVVF